jgi:hypothetical protein
MGLAAYGVPISQHSPYTKRSILASKIGPICAQGPCCWVEEVGISDGAYSA